MYIFVRTHLIVHFHVTECKFYHKSENLSMELVIMSSTEWRWGESVWMSTTFQNILAEWIDDLKGTEVYYQVW